MDLGSGSGVKPLWSGDSESGLVVGLLDAARGRVGSGSGRDIKVGSGSNSPWPGPGSYNSFKR